MFNPKWRYSAEKFAAARRMLMAPHPRGEAASFASAFHECSLGLPKVPADDLDPSARRWLQTIRETIDTNDIEDVGGGGTFQIKAERLTRHEKQEFSTAVDDLASWFASSMNE